MQPTPLAEVMSHSPGGVIHIDNSDAKKEEVVGATASSPPPMMERVQKRVMDKFFNAATTPQTKRVVAKVHVQLAQKDATFTTVVDRYQDVQSSQEISSQCIDLQRALG